MAGLSLRRLREEAGKTLRGVEADMGESGPTFTTISRWEKKGRIPDEWQQAYADSVGVGVEVVRRLSTQNSEPDYVGRERISEWRDRVYESDLSEDAKHIATAVAYFFKPEVRVVTLTIDVMVDRLGFSRDRVEAAWPEVIDSPFVEPVPDIEWVIRLVMPSESDA